MIIENKKTWSRILNILDGLNRRVKEPGWNFEDKQEVYRIKDAILSRIMSEKPQELEIQCYYVPYYSYSVKTKDKAGALMRSDPERNPFEYYLSLVEPCEEDIDIPSKATVEIVIICDESRYSFHQPIAWYQSMGERIDVLPKKPWISAPNHHHAILIEQRDRINTLLNSFNN